MDEDVEGTVLTDSPDSSVEVSQEPAGESYTVKVDGLEEQVSLDELRDGYQRQADYTRKTQELASERSRLQQAEAIVQSLEADPAGTLRLWVTHSVSVGQLGNRRVRWTRGMNQTRTSNDSPL